MCRPGINNTTRNTSSGPSGLLRHQTAPLDLFAATFVASANARSYPSSTPATYTGAVTVHLTDTPGTQGALQSYYITHSTSATSFTIQRAPYTHDSSACPPWRPTTTSTPLGSRSRGTMRLYRLRQAVTHSIPYRLSVHRSTTGPTQRKHIAAAPWAATLSTPRIQTHPTNHRHNTTRPHISTIHTRDNRIHLPIKTQYRCRTNPRMTKTNRRGLTTIPSTMAWAYNLRGKRARRRRVGLVGG